MTYAHIRKALAFALVAGAVPVALAQEGNTTFFGGEHIVAGGNAPVFSSFTPNVNDATSRMFNDGVTAGDTSSTDNIWTWTASGLTPSGDPLGVSEWKMGTWDGVDPLTNWSNEAPSGANNIYPTNEASVAFHWMDTDGSMGDGYLPDNNWVWTVPNNIGARMQAASSFSIWGNFGAELGGPGDWGGSLNHLPLIRNAGTQEWEVTLSGWQNLGNKEFKAVMNGGWAAPNEIGTNGQGGGNISFFLLNTADVITFRVREADGRYAIDGLTPLPTTDGIYALGPWTTDPESDSGMSVEANGFEFEGVVPNAGIHQVTVFEVAGGSLTRLWPAQGSHPIKTTVPGQTVRVNLHMTPMADGAFPDAEFVYSDPDSRVDFTATANGRLQWVGMLGIWGTRYSAGFNDFENPATDSLASNHPVGTQASDAFIYRWDAPTTNHGNALGELRAYKVVGQTDDIPNSITNVWAIQIGGIHDAGGGNDRKGGLTYLGDNPNPQFTFLDNTDYSLWVDTAVGRTKVLLSTDPEPDMRPARANDPVSTSVSDWHLH